MSENEIDRQKTEDNVISDENQLANNEEKSKGKFSEFANKFADKTKKVVIATSKGIKDGSEQLGDYIGQKKYEHDLKTLRPVFESDLTVPNFRLPSLFVVVEDDKRRRNKACNGAVGFYTVDDNVKILTLYKDYIEKTNLSFYPNLTETVYFVDPCQPGYYIDVDEYFGYMKKVRVDELEMIAHKLGAKYVQISISERNKEKTTQSSKISANYKAKDSIEHKEEQRNAISVSVETELNFEGSDNPEMPMLSYFKDEKNIIALVDMRMKGKSENSIKSKAYSFRCGNSLGMSQKDAINVGIAIQRMKIGEGVSFEKKIEKENNMSFEYLIEF